MKPNHKCDPARMALLYIRQQFICTTFKFDAYRNSVNRILRGLREENVITMVNQKIVVLDKDYLKQFIQA